MITPPDSNQQASWIQNLRRLLEPEFVMKWLPVLFSVFFLFVAVMASVYLTLRTQDVRRSASETDRDVELILVPSSTPFKTKTLSSVFIRLNTHGKQIDGLQVVFDMLNPHIDGVTLKVRPKGNMRQAWDDVLQIDGGFRVSLAAITKKPDEPFSSNEPVDIAELLFTVNDPSNIAMVFDDVLNKAALHKRGDNVLKPIVVQEYNVELAPSPSPRGASESNRRTTTTGGSTNRQTTGQTASPSPSATTTTSTKGTTGTGGPTATVTVTSSIDGDPNTGGSSSVASVCNEECTYSSECGDGFLCYQQQCRRIGNVTDASCKSDDETSTAKVCNETCSSSTQCQDELICYQGSCRDVSNPESPRCAKKTLSETQIVAELCNEECVTNAECGDHLSCYQGSCRLETNPTSESCVSDVDATSDTDDEAQASPSPDAADEDQASEDSSGVVGQILRVLLVVGLVVGLGVAGVVGYLWFKDRQTAGL